MSFSLARCASILRLVFLAPALAAAPAAAAAQQTSPETAIVEALQDGLVDIMQNPPAGGADARSAALGRLVNKTFDINAMGAAAVGIRTYEGWTGDQRRMFLNAFTRFMVASHAIRFENDAGQRFETGASEDTQAGRKLVHARYLRTDKDPVDIDYLVQETDEGWRILDVYLDGTVSLLALHRAEFAAVLRNKGFDGFIKAMNEKAEGLASQSRTN